MSEMEKETLKEMLSMKISNWESIPYSEGINCPNPDCDNKSYHSDARNLIGWCDTPHGLMMVGECKKCFTKYRFHGVVGSSKYDLDKFAQNFLKQVEMQKEGLI